MPPHLRYSSVSMYLDTTLPLRAWYSPNMCASFTLQNTFYHTHSLLTAPINYVLTPSQTHTLRFQQQISSQNKPSFTPFPPLVALSLNICCRHLLIISYLKLLAHQSCHIQEKIPPSSQAHPIKCQRNHLQKRLHWSKTNPRSSTRLIFYSSIYLTRSNAACILNWYQSKRLPPGGKQKTTRSSLPTKREEYLRRNLISSSKITCPLCPLLYSRTQILLTRA